MSKVKIEGNASGTGTFTIAAPNSNTDRTLEIPDTDGSFVTQTSGYDVSFYEDTGTTAKFFWDASAERLGIGTSSPSQKIHLLDSGSARINLGVFAANVERHAAIDAVIDAGTNGHALRFFTNGNGFDATERMRIDSSGNLLVGTTQTDIGYTASGEGASLSPAYIQVARNSTGAAVYLNKLGNTGDVIRFYQNTSQIGSISLTGSATSYNTSSDYRLKEDWQPMSGSIDRLKALNPVNFAWKADGSRVDGFLAHEAAEVVPEAVSGEKDAVEAIGNITDAEGTVVQENVLEPAELSEGQTWTKTEDRPVYQGIDQAKLVPLLTAALQEAVSKIEALETRIAALEA